MNPSGLLSQGFDRCYCLKQRDEINPSASTLLLVGYLVTGEKGKDYRLLPADLLTLDACWRDMKARSQQTPGGEWVLPFLFIQRYVIHSAKT